MVTTSPLTASVDMVDETSEFTLLVPAFFNEDTFGTSDHIGFAARCRVVPDLVSSTRFPTARTMWRAVAAEVEQLRDLVVLRSGLTRQEIARAMGVDRRSLSGFVKGEIRPTEERLRALRVLADTADWSANEFGEHARGILRGLDPDRSPLLLIAKGATDIRRELLAIAERFGIVPQTRIQTHVRETEKVPLYLKASGVWQGKGSLPTRAGVPRSDAEHEQDLSKAVPSVASPATPRRKGI
ncbi:helix-turn-helix domain-containing protein [Candidatus Poriferisocius sp.]|uniref:helix-turn-helix domain-containing protein n=1 Tax=Candidatus Poriferisocius sp. TaxID=3101276 RepID=UPI003B02172B